MIWFVLPAMLVVINDIFAYLFGYFFGKHQLIALSPKKTWEGYIGGAISTCLFSVIVNILLFSSLQHWKALMGWFALDHQLTLFLLAILNAQFPWTHFPWVQLWLLNFKLTLCFFPSLPVLLGLLVDSLHLVWKDQLK